MGTDGALRTIADAISGRGIRLRRAALIACIAAGFTASAPASASVQSPGTVTLSSITGSPGGYLVTVANTGKVAITSFTVRPGEGAEPKQFVPRPACSFAYANLTCSVSLQPGASFQMCYAGNPLVEIGREGYIAFNGGSAGYSETLQRGTPVSACPVPGFSSSSSGGGAGTCKVPKVVGKTQASAEKAIRKAGCKVGAIKKRRSSHVKKGTVVSQGVSAGRSVVSGTKIGLVVSKGK